MKKTRWTKAVAGFLCLCMLLSVIPMSAFAQEQTEPIPETTVPEQTEPIPETTVPEQTESVPETTVPEQTESVPETTVPEQTEFVPETTEPEQTESVPETTVPEQTEAPTEATQPETLVLPGTQTEFRRVTKPEDLTPGGRYAIVSGTTDNNNHNKYLHHTQGEMTTNHCIIDNPGDVIDDADDYAPQFKGTQAHFWKIEQSGDGYTIQSCTSDAGYLNYGDAGVFNQLPVTKDPAVFELAPGENNLWQISWTGSGGKTYLAYNGKWGAQTEPCGVYIYKETEKSTDLPVLDSDEGLLKAGADQVEKGTTEDQPFAGGTAGSSLFRIPALITLQNGWLLAAADARYATSGDGGGLDTIVSISKDDGKTWEYSMPIFFPDSAGYAGNKATTVIDPIVVQGGDGTIYVMADANPTGVTTMGGYRMPGMGTGYITVDGVERLALSSNYANVNTAPTDGDTDTYEYYVGDFDEKGYAPVVIRETGEPSEFVVDNCFNIYLKKDDGSYAYPYQTQVNSDAKIQQNVFYKDSVLHVYNTGYLWLASSKDNGETWDHTILNPQIKRDSETALLVSPGRGTVLRDGTIIIPMYNHYDTASTPGTECSSFIWSKDNGASWHRTGDVPTTNGFSSECELVELDDGTLRLFVRSGTNCVAYADAHWDGSNYVWDTAVTSTGVPARSGCNVSAIMYSKPIDGKDAILVAQPGNPGSRTQGRIWVFLLEPDNTMTLGYTFAVNEDSFAYSCLTELDDGRVGLLWEYQGAAITFSTYDIQQIAKGAVVDNQRNLTIPLYGTFTEELEQPLQPQPMPDESILKLDIQGNTVTYTGVKEGTVTFTDASTGYRYTVQVAPEKLEELTVKAGQTMRTELPAGVTAISREPDSAVASAQILFERAEDLVDKGDCPGSLGSDASHTGKVVGMREALYTFQKQENGYVVSAQTADGKTVYLNIKDGGANIPNQTGATTIGITDLEGGQMMLTDQDTGPNGSILYFHRDKNNANYLKFDRNGRAAAPNTSFLLYRPAKPGETAAAELPGYVRLTNSGEIVDGGQYLIMAEVDGAYYGLYPADDEGNAHLHVVKADPQRVISHLEITGVGAGVTDLVAGGTVYRVTVTEDPTDPTVPPTEQTDPTVPPTEQTDPTVPPTEQTDPTVPPTEQTDPTVPPTEGTKPVPGGKPGTPNTGDTADAGLMAGVFFLAMGVGVALLHTLKKKERN